MGYSKLLTAVVFPFVFVLCLLLTNADTYNIDVKTVRKFTGPKDSNFGYSVAQYKEKGVGWVIAIASYTKKARRDAGAVYRCDPKTDNSCSAFKRVTNATTENWHYPSLGYVVHTSGVDGFILTCDMWYIEKDRNNGMCYLISDNFTKIVEFSLCRQGNLCSMMHRGSISQDSKYIYIETHDDRYEGFRVFSVMKDAVYDEQFYYYASQAMMPNSTIYVKGITLDTYQLDDPAAIKLPTTSKEGFVDGVVMVARRNSNKEIKEVLVYTWDFTKVKTFVIDKVDGNRGRHWICVADVDGDGKQDIIVAVEVKERYNIHVYYQGGHVCSLNDQKCWENTFNRTTILDNYDIKTPRVHYLASLGDINQDGCEDFAVTVCSEEFADSMVYIYHGSVDGVRNQPSQILGAREITGINSHSHFGYSIAGGFDLDNNGYPDITVGSTNVVYHFRSKPVVRVMANLTYLLNTKYIDINQTVSRNITLRLCLRYTGVGVHPTSELITTVVTLDSLKPDSPRLIFKRLADVFPLTENDTMCKNYVTILKCIIEDTSTPIVANLSYSLLDSDYTELGQVLDPYYIGKHNDSLFIKYDGVSVNICIPELDLKLTSDVEIYRVETCDKVVVNVTIENRKDDSFGTKLYLNIPLGLTYVKVDQSTGTTDLIYCHSLNQTALICDLGNTLPGPASVKFGLIFQPVYVDTKMWNYTFVGILNCTNPYFKPKAADNVKTFVLPIFLNATVSLTGQSYPERVHFNYSDYNYSVSAIKEDVQAGPPLDHKYTVINMGSSIVSTAELIIYWPSYTDTGDNLLYLLYEPDVKGNVSCLHIGANHLNLKLVSLRKDYFYGRDSDSSAKTRPEKASINYEGRLPGRNRNSAEGSKENCGTAICTLIKCTINQLGKNEEAVIVLRSLVWIKTQQQNVQTDNNEYFLKFNREIVFTSKATVTITEFPQIGKLGLQWNRTFNIFTNVMSDDADPPTSDKISLLWIIILLLVIGIFVAFLVIYLYRKGRFSKINRSSNQPDISEINRSSNQPDISEINRSSNQPDIHLNIIFDTE